MFSGEIFICCVFPLVHSALCCNCMMIDAFQVAQFDIDEQQKYLFSYANFSMRDAVATVHPLCLFGKIHHFVTIF